MSADKAENMVVMFLDAHGSRRSPELIRWALDRGLVLIGVLPNCTSLHQVLDVGLFGIIKRMYNTRFPEWLSRFAPNSNAPTLSKLQRASLMMMCYFLAADHVPGAVKKGGMYPTFTIDTLGDVQKQKIAQATMRRNGVEADVSSALYGRIEDSLKPVAVAMDLESTGSEELCEWAGVVDVIKLATGVATTAARAGVGMDAFWGIMQERTNVQSLLDDLAKFEVRMEKKSAIAATPRSEYKQQAAKRAFVARGKVITEKHQQKEGAEQIRMSALAARKQKLRNQIAELEMEEDARKEEWKLQVETYENELRDNKRREEKIEGARVRLAEVFAQGHKWVQSIKRQTELHAVCFRAQSGRILIEDTELMSQQTRIQARAAFKDDPTFTMAVQCLTCLHMLCKFLDPEARLNRYGRVGVEANAEHNWQSHGWSVYVPSTVAEAVSDGIFPRTSRKAMLTLQYAGDYALRSGASFTHSYGALETADGKKEDEAKVSGAVADRKAAKQRNAESTRDRLKAELRYKEHTGLTDVEKCVGGVEFGGAKVQGFVRDVASLGWLPSGKEKEARKLISMTKEKLKDNRDLLIVVMHDFNERLVKWRENFGVVERLPAAVQSKRKKKNGNKRKTAPAQAGPSTSPTG